MSVHVHRGPRAVAALEASYSFFEPGWRRSPEPRSDGLFGQDRAELSAHEVSELITFSSGELPRSF